MTKPKQVANTLKRILDHKLMKTMLDKGSNIDTTVEEVLAFWNFDLYSRKPGPAYKNGVFEGTDLDMAAFLYALVDRGAVINLPEYKAAGPSRVKEGQVLTSKENRHGPLLGLVANKDVFKFSVKVKDMNVMTSESVGDYRTFSLTGPDGNWYDGWKQIDFMPSANENNFINDNKLWFGNQIVFKNFIHPNRWTSFYGQYYFLTKAMMERLSDEASYYKAVVKEMLAAGIDYPESDKKESVTTYPVGGSAKEKVEAFEVEIDIPEFTGEYAPIEHNQENLVKYSRLANDYIYKIIPKLRFMTRATEFALKQHGDDTTPSWMNDVKWERDYVQKGKRKKWDRLVLFQPAPGQTGVALRKRVFEKSIAVSA